MNAAVQVQRQLSQHSVVSAFEVQQKPFCLAGTWPSSQGGGTLTDGEGDSSRGELEDVTNLQGNPGPSNCR